MSTRSLPNGNRIKAAVVLLCSFVPLGCAESPRPALSRIWGPDRVIFKEVPFKNAAGRLTSIVRREKSNQDKSDEAALIAASSTASTRPGATRTAQSSHAITATSRPETTAPKRQIERAETPISTGLASSFAGQNGIHGELNDPFAGEEFAPSVTPAANTTGIARTRQVDHVASEPQTQNPFEAASHPERRYPPTSAPETNPFVTNMESQLERLRAAVEDEYEPPGIRETEAERLAAARQRVNDLVQQAASEVLQGRFADAERTLQSASDLVEQRGIFYGPDEEQPGDLLRRVRDRMDAERHAETTRFVEEAAATINDPDEAEISFEPDQQVEAAAAEPVEQFDPPISQDNVRAESSTPPSPEPRSISDIRIVPKPNASDFRNRPMIVDAKMVPDRFSNQPVWPAEVTVPTGSKSLDSQRQPGPGSLAPAQRLPERSAPESPEYSLPGYRPSSLDYRLRTGAGSRNDVSINRVKD